VTTSVLIAPMGNKKVLLKLSGQADRILMPGVHTTVHISGNQKIEVCEEGDGWVQAIQPELVVKGGGGPGEPN
jgi:hypothetical protein